MAERIGLYPGTFDPITLGHMDIVRRGLKLVDTLVIGVGKNPAKDPMFSADERVALVEQEAGPLAKGTGSSIEVVAFDQLLMKMAESVGASVIIRGLRAVSDFEYEFQMAGMNAYLNPDVETVFLMAGAEYQPIASRLVKEIAGYGGDISSFVPPAVEQAILDRIEARKHE